MDLLRYYHTLRHLKPIQFFYRAYYLTRSIFRRAWGYKPCFSYYKEGHSLIPKANWIDKAESCTDGNKFCFLNIQNEFRGVWDDGENGDLWRYNLNYMDFLLQPSMTFDEGYAWIERFIASMSVNSVVCAPYPISLRGMNWIKFVSIHNDRLTPRQRKTIDTALYSQYKILLQSTEKHLMANHYLENGFSLLHAACYFNDKTFYGTAKKILYSQLKEQILEDGAHFELSPMYHCIILERLLDCCNIIHGERDCVLYDFLKEKAVTMLGWLDAVVMSDGNIPLLNDSALDIAAIPDKLFAYAKSLGFEWDAVKLGVSGYRKYTGLFYDAFVDVAALGPRYNLGHSHADTFTFVMNVGNKPFIVDTGVSTYASGERRCYERSTLAHNTVSLNGTDSSQVWGAFRCAGRASVKLLGEDENSVTASHDGYESQSGSVTRSFMNRGTEFEIVDEVSEINENIHPVAAFHLAPEVVVESVGADNVVTSLGVFLFTGALSMTVDSVEVAFSYNQLCPSTRISVSFSKRLKSVVLPKEKNDTQIITK